jgi:cell division protein FtsB
MAHASLPTMPARSGPPGSPPLRCPPIRTRRRLLLVLLLCILIGIAVLANYGPVQAYRDAHTRLENAKADVAALEKQKTELLAELGKLNEAAYLESLAREALTYARPGEEVYIVTGLGDDGTTGTGSAGTAGSAHESTGVTGSDGGPTGVQAELPEWVVRLFPVLDRLF